MSSAKASFSGRATDDAGHLFDNRPPPASITAIRPLEDDPNLREIHVDGTQRCIVRAADVDELHLAVDQHWTDALAADVAHRAHRVQARRRALQLLGRKAYSSRQVQTKLEKNFEPDVAAAVVDELLDDGWIDDRAVAADLIQSALQRSPAGPPLLREKLLAAGIDKALADEVIADAIEAEDLHERTVAYLTHEAERTSVRDAATARRLAARLARRGLEEEMIRSALEAAGFDLMTDETD